MICLFIDCFFMSLFLPDPSMWLHEDEYQSIRVVVVHNAMVPQKNAGNTASSGRCRSTEKRRGRAGKKKKEKREGEQEPEVVFHADSGSNI